MVRKRRVEYEGAIYHVIQRGNNREFIFDRDYEKRFLLEEIGRQKLALGFNLYGYAVMGNHYHLILQMVSEPLHKIMHYINTSYSKYYNYIKERTGHVFGGRYKAIPVQDEKYILTLLRYVHQNPVRAGICNYVWEYPWSSDVFYRENRNDFVDTDFILDIMSGNRAEAIEMYKQFLLEEETADYDSIDKVGDANFDPGFELTNPNLAKELDKILLNTGLSTGEAQLIKNGSRKRYLSPYKKAYAEQARKQGYTLNQIAQHIGLSDYAIYKLLNY